VVVIGSVVVLGWVVVISCVVVIGSVVVIGTVDGFVEPRAAPGKTPLIFEL